MDAVTAYSHATLGWHLVQALPLIIWPSAIHGLLTIDDADTMQVASTVANYFARSLGFALIALGLATVVLTGALPLNGVVDTPADTISPYALAMLLITTLHHASTAFYCWARYNHTSQTGYLLGSIGSASVGAIGLWCLMFGGDKARISKRTGADKRTSGWPFKNAEADKRKAGKKR